VTSRVNTTQILSWLTHRDDQLNSTSAREVMLAISTLLKTEGMIVVASIHRLSLEMLVRFTNVIFLAWGPRVT